MKIPTLAAYEQARRALRVVCEPSLRCNDWVQIRGSAAKGKKNRPSSDGLFSLARGYEKDILGELPQGFELKESYSKNCLYSVSRFNASKVSSSVPKNE